MLHVFKNARRRSIRRLGVVAVTLPMIGAGLLTTPVSAQAEETAIDTVSVDHMVATVVEETYTTGFRRMVDKRSYGAETQGLVMGGGNVDSGDISTQASGSGGTSTASGCRTVTVKNEAETVLGFTAYYYNTWTSYCWTRSTQTVYNVSNGWSITDVDPQQNWIGEVDKELLFYDYGTNDGHPRSAYKHWRKGHFENVVPVYGTWNHTYPTNTIRAYYNGTWAWATSG